MANFHSPVQQLPFLSIHSTKSSMAAIGVLLGKSIGLSLNKGSRLTGLSTLRGWVIGAVILAPQAITIAELCSSMPTNGAFYWYTAALAPPSVSRPLSFLVGWISTLATFTSLASFAYACAAGYSALIPVARPEWSPTGAQTFAISLAILLGWCLLNMLRIERIAIVMIGIGTKHSLK